jgi:hypothetical protein
MELNMSASPASAWRETCVIIALLAVLGLRIGMTRGQPVPQPIDHRQVQPWMADCLPGVGAKRRESVTEAIRQGDLQALPKQARAQAQQMFSGWPALP